MAADLPAPVVDGAEADEGRLELGDPGLGEDAGVGAGLDGGVLGREPEGVEAQGAEDGLAPHGLVAAGQVAERVVADVPLMGGSRGVGVHAQGVELLARVVVVDLVGALFLPVALPLPFHRIDVVPPCHATRVGDTRNDPDQARCVVPLGRGPARRWGDGRTHGSIRRTSTASVASATGGVAQLVERLTGSQEVRGFKSHRLHQI